MSGFYIHIPFCKKACNYCDFHFSTQLQNKSELINSICKEIELRRDYLKTKTISSIYFGGGTPSLLSETEINKILNTVHAYFNWDNTIEITFEANPDDITSDKLSVWKKSGINRLSIGLQSFNNEELRWMNRTHTSENSENCVKLAQDKGFENISIDLIYGSKFQTLESWKNTLIKVIDLKTKHISAYNLTIEQKTTLGIKFNKGLEPAVNEELSSEQFLRLSEILTQNNFIHYEISNFGKENYFAKHNSNYWLGKNYLGIGPSAHSYNGSSRQWNLKNNALYIQKINNGETFFEIENLSLQNKYNEYVLTRLRTIWGCDVKEMENLFGQNTTNYFLQKIKNKKQFVTEKNSIYTLNNAGRLHADGIAADLFL